MIITIQPLGDLTTAVYAFRNDMEMKKKIFGDSDNKYYSDGNFIYKLWDDETFERRKQELNVKPSDDCDDVFYTIRTF